MQTDQFAGQVIAITGAGSGFGKLLAQTLSASGAKLVLSDVNLQFCEAMKLPTFEVDGMRLVKRVTMIAENNIVVKVHYPIFPSDTDATWVIEQLSY